MKRGGSSGGRLKKKVPPRRFKTLKTRTRMGGVGKAALGVWWERKEKVCVKVRRHRESLWKREKGPKRTTRNR